MAGIWDTVPADGQFHPTTRQVMVNVLQANVNRSAFRVPDQYYTDMNAITVEAIRRFNTTQDKLIFSWYALTTAKISIVVSMIPIDPKDLNPPYYIKFDYLIDANGLIVRNGVINWEHASFTQISQRETLYPNTSAH